jgi:hypothetical protein
MLLIILGSRLENSITEGGCILLAITFEFRFLDACDNGEGELVDAVLMAVAVA